MPKFGNLAICCFSKNKEPTTLFADNGRIGDIYVRKLPPAVKSFGATYKNAVLLKNEQQNSPHKQNITSESVGFSWIILNFNFVLKWIWAVIKK